MQTTTIKLRKETKAELDQFREYKSESYDELINKMMFITKNVKDNLELSQEAVLAIEKARERIKKGNYVSEEEAKKRLGF